MKLGELFREVVVLDFEYSAPPGENPKPLCMVSHELRSGRRFRIWRDQFESMPPHASGPDVLCVFYYGSGDLNCYRALGWPIPERILDLFCEFRCLTNGLPKASGSGLLGALVHFGIDGAGVTEKKEMQAAIGNDTWQGQYNKHDILNYCESDVVALTRLLAVLLPRIDLPHALLRGRYMAACAFMEYRGVPIDTETLALLRQHWGGMQDALIAEIDKDYRVFDGRTFKYDRFAELLVAKGTPWPQLESGRLDLSDEAFRQQSKAYPWVAPLRELRTSLSELRLESLAVGSDRRNRTLLSPFRAKTSRNQPSNAKFVFGPATWIRSLIKPEPGYGLAYIDWRAQEIGVAAKLSGDLALQDAYRSGDPYIDFGKRAGLVPLDATKATHPTERELCKLCFLATGYGQGEHGLAQRIGRPLIVAKELLRAHRQSFRTFWQWSDAAVDTALLSNRVHTVFGWVLHRGENPNPRSLRNFPVQANACEMMRLAACIATERRVGVCAPVHDAFLIDAPLERLDADIAAMRSAMAEASRVVLSGFELDTEATIVRAPDRYMDPRGRVMWERTIGLLQRSIGSQRRCA
jgi:hypothetical protein